MLLSGATLPSIGATPLAQLLTHKASRLAVDAGNTSSLHASTPLVDITLTPTNATFAMFIHEPRADLMSEGLQQHHSHDGKVVMRAICALRAISQDHGHAQVLLDIGANMGIFALTAAAEIKNRCNGARRLPNKAC